MARRLIHTTPKSGTEECQAKVYRDTEWDEYLVEFHTKNGHNFEADYHTENKADAISTADRFARIGGRS